MKRDFFKLALFCLVPLVIAYFLLDPSSTSPLLHPIENGRRQSCQTNLKILALALQAYREDYDQRWILAAGNNIPRDAGYGWGGAQQSYIKNIWYLQCPSEMHPLVGPPSSKLYSDYWLNGNVSSLLQSKITNPSHTFSNGDSESGDATMTKTRLPTDWKTQPNGEQPPWWYRHLRGANYSFIDGHVKWLVPEQISSEAGKLYTFSTR